jgi:uncharacterized protein YijF (DUF1287 family)
VIIRALRNAGLDLQARGPCRHRALAALVPDGQGPRRPQHRSSPGEDAPALLAPATSQSAPAALDDAADPLRPGDVVLFDTFPSRSGPDHIGIVSDTLGDSGQPLIINNWTDGTVTAEMDLLAWLPVTHRFRVLPKR